jgi:hypothetical protein
MVFLPRLKITLKALLQLGIGSLALYAVYRLGLKTGHYRRMEGAPIANGRLLSAVHPLFSLPDRNQLLKILGKDGTAALSREADQVVRGRIRLFGNANVPLTLAFSGPLQHWTAYATGNAQLPPSRSVKPQSADIKFLWEPARFGWAFTLGRAYYLSGKEKYAEAFWKYFEKFRRGNPPYLGPHWMNGQEVAIRMMALVWCAQVFSTASASTAKRNQRLAQSIVQHAARIPPTLIYARSQSNNHLITESAALFAAGVAVDHRPWRDLGWHWLNHALQRQIGSYGEYVQHSTNYHRLMLQTALWVDAILRGRREVWPAETLQALMRASHWLFSMIDPASGRAPNLGANDGALVLPLSSAPFDDYRPTVQAAARAFLRTGLPAGPWDELSLWLGLPAAKYTAGSVAYAADHLHARNAWAYLRASSFKSRLAHMDQLHFDLWWRGLNVAQDAGTYLYHGPAPWDNSFVSTRVHNTVTVDERDQMTRGGRFLTLDWFPAYSKNLLTSDDRVLGRMLAYHKGYQRLGVRHERLASVFDDGRWEVTDSFILTGPGEHVFRLHWLLLEGEWRLEDRPDGIQFRLRLPRGWMRLNISGSGFTESALRTTVARAGRLLYGDERPHLYEGWASPTYGQKVPALSLAVEAASAGSCSFISEFLFPA